MFREFVLQPERLDAHAIDPLEEVVNRYPWFSTARLLLLVAYDNPQATRAQFHRNYLALRLGSYPIPLVLMADVKIALRKKFADFQVIDAFLQQEDVHLKLGQNTDCEDDKSENSTQVPLEHASESLARLYVTQGLFDQAKAIYRKLSLKYPEKSVYFAQLIHEMDRK